MLRTHLCSNLDEKNIGENVKLCGWCNTYRDHGGVVFIDLRDKSGIINLFATLLVQLMKMQVW